MIRASGLILALLLSLAACGGGGSASNTSNSGLTPLDFDVAVDPESGDVDVIGYAVERTHPMFDKAAASVPAGEELVALLLFEPEMAPGAFSGDFTVRTTDRSASKAASAAAGYVYRGIWDSRSQVWNSFRKGVYSHGTGGSFLFDLDFLGIVMLTRPSGPQFKVAAFADLSQAQVDTEINFWAISHGGTAPVTFEWSFGDGSTAQGDKVSYVYPVLGEYNVTLTATDSAGKVAPVASTPISIVANPVPLTQVDVVVTDNGDGSFSYSATLDGGTPPFEYAWDFDGDGEVDARQGSPVVCSPRTNLFRGNLTVTDQAGASVQTGFVTDNRKITLSSDIDFGYAPQEITFNVATEGAEAGDLVTIHYGDGDAGVDALHLYDFPGDYSARAILTRVIDGVEYSVESNQLRVLIEPRPAPRIDSVTPARATVGSEVTLTGEFFFIPEVNDEVLIGLLPMPVVSWEPDRIVVTVPQGARDGDIVVHKALGDLDSNPVPFDVAPGTPGGPGLGQL